MKLTRAHAYTAAAVAAFALWWLSKRHRPDDRVRTTEGASTEAEQQRLAGMRGWFARLDHQHATINAAAAAATADNLNRAGVTP